MGTRADFYVGRGKTAKWIGSIAMDGYPEGHPNVLVKLTGEAEFRAKAAGIIKKSGHGTTPEQGWPWPWKNSNTTDYAYAFDAGRVWASCFGHGWWPADEKPPDGCFPKNIEWPEMPTDQAAPAGHDRSGIIMVTAPAS